MSDQDQLQGKVAHVIEMLREMHARRPEDNQPRYPTSAMLIEALKRKPMPLDHDEQPEEFTVVDYDAWVYQAINDLIAVPPRFHSCPNDPRLIECPRARVLRIGREAEQDGKSSALFHELMTLTQNGKALPQVTARALRTAQKYLDVASAFREFAADIASTKKTFKELKCEFRRQRESCGIFVSESTLERALRAHDLDWSAYAYATPRKGRRKTHAGS